MLSLSYTAGERFALLIAEANAPDDAAIRLIVDGNGFNLGIDTVRLGDTTFDHLEKVVLAIDEQVSELLTDMKLDVEVTGDQPRLVLIEKLQE